MCKIKKNKNKIKRRHVMSARARDNERLMLTQAEDRRTFPWTEIRPAALWKWAQKNRASGEKLIKMHAGHLKWAMFESQPEFGLDIPSRLRVQALQLLQGINRKPCDCWENCRPAVEADLLNEEFSSAVCRLREMDSQLWFWSCLSDLCF